MSQIILIHLVSLFFLTGVIWLVQLLHYPSFASFEESKFIDLMKWHQMRVSWVVIPAMLIELITGGWICWLGSFHDLIWNVNFALIILTWLSTMIFQGPVHGKLLLGYSQSNIRYLVQTNWIRTLLWSVRAALLLFYLI
jgi:hypothetical protein